MGVPPVGFTGPSTVRFVVCFPSALTRPAIAAPAAARALLDAELG